MNCPTCKEVKLTMSERNGVEIDYCSECRGVWLDRGELDKIIEKSNLDRVNLIQESRPSHQVPQCYDQQPMYRPKRKKSFLEEIFD